MNAIDYEKQFLKHIEMEKELWHLRRKCGNLKKGVFIETDAGINAVKWISVYIRELDNEDFENANW